ncbi:MAG: flagellar export protein FliJ [Candidatus Melainabacteria bacterium]|nr:flagellar export protein FliJ [Candidatus Melainabacteria bacterium]
MPFVFRLERVLTIRRQALERARLAVIAAQKALQEAQLHVETCKRKLKEKHEELLDSNYSMAEDYLRVIKSLDDDLTKAKQDLIRKEQELEARKKELIEAQKKVEALEKLREKQEEEYKLEEARLEQKLIDEKVTMQYANEMVAKPELDSELVL